MQAAVRPGQLGDGVLVEMLYSGISRGTERLVAEGRVPDSEHDRMRGPAQEGRFPYPVKYGYAAVGRVVEGPLAGRAVFALHPHQTRFRMPDAGLTLLPDTLPPARAVLAANMETALNLVWDGAVMPGDRVAVIGAGVVGALVGYLVARIVGTNVTLVDIAADRAKLARTMGCTFTLPDSAPADCDVVFHLSATASGLATAIACAGTEASVIEGSWYGAGVTSAPLGGAFHSRRLRLIGSQVGRIPPARAPRWTYERRMAMAVCLLEDPALDALFTGETDFSDLADKYAAILSNPGTLCHRIRYNPSEELSCLP